MGFGDRWTDGQTNSHLVFVESLSRWKGHLGLNVFKCSIIYHYTNKHLTLEIIHNFHISGYTVGFWPLPEAFWPDVTATSLPPRSAHPTLKFTCTNQEPMVIENLPFDKYELEPSPLTLFILGRKQPNYCWQVFIQGSTRNGDTGHPFGYLKVMKKENVRVLIWFCFKSWQQHSLNHFSLFFRRAQTCWQWTCSCSRTTIPCCCRFWMICSKFTNWNQQMSGELSSTIIWERCLLIMLVSSDMYKE